jgi:hypothetical protein
MIRDGSVEWQLGGGSRIPGRGRREAGPRTGGVGHSRNGFGQRLQTCLGAVLVGMILELFGIHTQIGLSRRAAGGLWVTAVFDVGSS